MQLFVKGPKSVLSISLFVCSLYHTTSCTSSHLFKIKLLIICFYAINCCFQTYWFRNCSLLIKTHTKIRIPLTNLYNFLRVGMYGLAHRKLAVVILPKHHLSSGDAANVFHILQTCLISCAWVWWATAMSVESLDRCKLAEEF